MAAIKIDLAAEFIGKKAFKDAGNATTSLEKQVGKLGKQMLTVFSVTAVAAFGKAAVKAFAEDEAAATRLASAVDNLGISFANVRIATFISDLEKSASVADDLLRPAFQTLLTTTGSLEQSQRLLNLAIETSRGSGVELTTVAQDLGNAYVGNTRGLRKYNLGLSQAQLKTMSFTDVQEKLNKQFTGSNAAFLDTAAGKLAAITIATDNLSESVGGALLDSFAALAGGDGVGGLVKRIDILSDKIIKAGQEFQVFTLITRLAFSLTPSSEREKQVEALRRSFAMQNARPFEIGNNAVTGYAKDEAAAKKADADAAKRRKELAKLTATQVKQAKALTAEQRRQAQAKKQSALFDLDQIGLVAALQGNLSEQDRLRARLQLALLTENTTEADRLSQRLANSIDSTGKLAAFLATMPDARNPFTAWDEWLRNFSKNLANATGSAVPTTTGAITPAPSIPTTNVPNNPLGSITSPSSFRRGEEESMRLYNASQAPIIVQIDGKAIVSAVQDQSLSGMDSSIRRTLGNFAR